MAITINLEKALRPWQKEYFQNKKRYNVLVVHRRAWKTVGTILDLMVECIRTKWDYWYIAPTYKQAKKIAWRMIQKFGDQIKDFKYNSSELQVTYRNGSTISLFGAENPDSLRGLDLVGVIFDEYSQQPSWIYSEIIFPMINANRGWVTWIGTPKWKNSFYKLYQRGLSDEKFYVRLLRHSQTDLLDAEQIADARKEMTEEEFEQEYNCSWDAHIQGAVYGKEIAIAYNEERIRKDIYDPDLPVTTFWDLGMSDAMAIIFVQTVWKEIRIIDTYKNSGFGLEHYANVCSQKPYKYANHYFPHDIRNRELGTWTSRLEIAIQFLGKNCKVVPMNTIESGINAGRLIFKNLYIDESLEDFLNDLSLYRYEYNERLWEFSKNPLHDFTSHFADAYRYLATIYEFLTKNILEVNHEKNILVGLDLEIFWNDWETTEFIIPSAY